MTPIDRFYTDDAPVRITKRIQLLVEGNDQRNFAEALLSRIGRSDIEVQNFGGVTELGEFLAALQESASFEMVKSIGILRDAEHSVAAAFQSVQDAVKNAALPIPSEIGSRAAGAPGVTVFILGGDGGMLETLLNRTVEGKPEQRAWRSFCGASRRNGVSRCATRTSPGRMRGSPPKIVPKCRSASRRRRSIGRWITRSLKTFGRSFGVSDLSVGW